jgi:hypothetical protein
MQPPPRENSALKLALCLLLAQASTAHASPLVGTWQRPGIQFQIFPDASYIWNAPPTQQKGSVLFQGQMVRFLVQNVPQPYYVDYQFLRSGNMLRLRDVYGNMTDFQLIALPSSPGEERPRLQESPPVTKESSPPPRSNQPANQSASRTQKLAFLELVKTYASMNPDLALKRYDALTPDQRQYLVIFQALHNDMIKSFCRSPRAQQRVFEEMGTRTNCAETIRQDREAQQLLASLGMPYDGNRTEVATQQTSVSLSLECDLGFTAKANCQNWTQTQQNISTMRHVTNMNMIENMGPEPRYEWKVVPRGN